jgi:hypothetical protein
MKPGMSLEALMEEFSMNRTVTPGIQDKLLFVVLTIGLLSMFSGCTATNQGAFERVLAGQSRVVDLSHVLKPGIPEGEDGALQDYSSKDLGN